MAINHRKLFPLINDTNITGDSCPPCFTYCRPGCPPYLPDYPLDYPPPPPIPPLSLLDDQSNRQISPFVFIIVAILGTCFLLVTYYAIIVKYCSNWPNSRRHPPQSEDTHEDFLDENHGPVLDHPIWFINTVGLEQSIINAITVCKYKKGDGLIEGTECSVCLSEFQEDETLRLLPKCSHAFHLRCIDTWLRSHTNCPLCRARIVSHPIGSTPTATVFNSSNLDLGEETLVENSDGGAGGGVGSDQSGEGELVVGIEAEGELQDGRRDVETGKEGEPSPHSNCDIRVLSDLADNHRVAEDEIQPMRRSVSMDSSSVSMFCFSLANFLPVEGEGSSTTPVVGGKKSNLTVVPGNAGISPSIFRLMGSSSKGRLLQKGPVSMKRSFSSGGKFLLSRYSRNQNSILPL